MHLLFLVTSLLVATPALSLFEDQIGKFDWTHKSVGGVKFAEFDVQGNSDGGPAKRIIVATGQNVLAALNSKNGDIHWRQILEEGSIGAIDSLYVANGEASVVTGNPPLIRSFDTATAALVSETSLGLSFKHPQDYGTRLVKQLPSTVLVAHISSGSAEVSVFSSSSGALKKQITSQAPWLSQNSQCQLSSSNLVCVEPTLSLVFALSLSGSGEQSFSSTSLSAFGLSVSAPSASDDDCPYSKPVISVAPVHGTADYLNILTSSNEVVTVHSTSKGIKKVREGSIAMSIIDDTSLFASSQGDLFVKITGYDLNTNQELIARSLTWKHEAPSQASSFPDVKKIIVQQYKRRGDNELAVIALIVLEDDSIHLVAAPGVMWSREESLASVLAVEAVDLPVSATSVSMHEQSKSKSVLGSFIQRIIAQTSGTLLYLADWLEDSLTSSGASPSSHSNLVRDEFNLHKLLIVATASGKLMALDNWSGEIIWSSYIPQMRSLPSDKMLLFLQRSVAHFPLPPLMTLVAMQKDNCLGAVYSFNPLTGEPTGEGLTLLTEKISQASLLTQQDAQFAKPVMVVSTSLSVQVFPPVSGENVLLQHKDFIYVTTRNSSYLFGHSLKFSEKGNLFLTPVWSAHFPPGTITGVYPKRSAERLHSSGRVMADRSVLYKYSNPNLAVVVAQGHDPINKNVLSIYLVDLVSGAVVDWISHQRVSGPVHVMHSENWIVYTYYNDKQSRNELHSMELFEGPTQANSTAFSSFAGLPQSPIVEKQSYILPEGIQASTHTITEKGITNKFLLMALQRGGIVQISRWLVDPRRPVSNARPHEEGLLLYVPEIPIPPTEVISYNQSFPRVRGIYSGPTGLESTCIVFAYGLDLFFTRVFPSKMYDMLKDDFDYLLITGVLVSLTVAAFVTRKLAQRKALYNLWK